MQSIFPSRRRQVMGGALALLTAAALLPLPVQAGGRTLFVQSAVENADGTATLPLYRGTSQGRTVWYVLLDSSDGNDASRLGINRADKLVNARGSAAVQKVKVINGVVDFPASVNFSGQRVVVPGPTGFPPAAASPGPVGEPGYSPLIELPDGTIRNAPQVANGTGIHGKVARIDTAGARVDLIETLGVSNGRFVRYISTESSDPGAAALENSTYAPALNAAPGLGDDSGKSSRATLAPFVNGQTGLANPQRQGLNSALLDGADPLNIAFWTPNQGRYSPLWDVFPAAWTDAAIAAGLNLRQMDRSQLLNRVGEGLVTGPGGAGFGAGGFVVNCPIVSSD